MPKNINKALIFYKIQCNTVLGITGKDMEFLNLVNTVILLVAGYMILHMLLTTPVSSYNFSSVVKLTLMIICTGVFLTGSVIATESHKFRSEGAVTYATPVEFTSVLSSEAFTNVDYRIKYSYQDKNGISHSSTTSVSEYEWQLLKVSSDPKLKIVYLESQPEKSKLESEDSYYVGLMLATSGILGFLGILLRRKRYKFVTRSVTQMAGDSGIQYKHDPAKDHEDDDINKY